MTRSLKILLLQARNADDLVRDEEIESFASKAGIDRRQITPHDLLTGPPSLADVQKHDALMVGGSGDFYVTKGNLPRFSTLLDVLAEVVDRGHPTFASCFGFQLLVKALGGELIHDPSGMEVGTFEIRLTEDGRSDELVGSMQPTFFAQVGRKDRATRLPQNVLHLASSDRCPYHALRVPGHPIWATQFHPELTKEENRLRFLRYQEGYAPLLSRSERVALLDGRFRESPETHQLIPRFLSLVFG